MDVYNPGRPIREVSSAPLIGRGAILSDLFDSLRRPANTILPPHVLIRSQSGMGKTALLWEIWHYGRTEPNLDWFPLALIEDHFPIRGLFDIWRRALEAMAARTQRVQSDPGLASFRSKIAALPREEPDAALQLLVETIQQSGRFAVLLIDDLDELLRKIESGHRSFFETLQSESAIRVIGTCSHALQGDYLEQAVSNRVFRILDLKSLNELESLEFLRRSAKDAHRPDIESELHPGARKAQGLIELSGGNPRTLCLLFPLLATENREFPVRSLGEILDRITPWYKRRFQQLASPTQRVLHLLALHREGLDLRTINEQAGGHSKQNRSILNELKDQDMLEERIPDHPSRPIFQIREKLICVWCLWRSWHPSDSRFEWLVYFLELFYDAAVRENMARKQLAIPVTDEIDVHYRLAFARTLRKKNLARALQFSVLKARAEFVPSLQNEEHLIDLHRVDRNLAERIHRSEDFARLRQAQNSTQMAQKGLSPAFFDLFFGSPSLSEKDKRKLPEYADSRPPEQWRRLEAFLSGESDRWRSLLKHHASILYKAIACGLMATLDDTEGAEIAGELWQDPVIPAISHDARLNRIPSPEKEELETIEAAYHEAIRCDGQLPILWRNLASLQQAYFGRYDDAESSLRRAIALDPQHAPSWTGLGCLLKNLPNRLTDAENAYRQALKIEPCNPNSYNDLGWFLYQYRGRPEDANRLVRKALELDPDHLYSFHTLATLLVREDRWQEAVPYLQRFIEGCDVQFNRSAWKDVLSLFREITRANKTAEAVAVLEGCSCAPTWNAVWEVLAAKDSDSGSEDRPDPSEISIDPEDSLRGRDNGTSR